jgi:hypothetical protein
MKFLKDLWNRIVCSNDEQYLIKIKELEATIGELNDDLVRMQSDLSDEIDNYLFMKSQFESMQETKNQLLEELDILKHKEAEYTIPTDIIDTSKFAYLPSTLFYYMKNNKIQSVSRQFTPSKAYRMWTDEMYKYFKNAVKNCKTFDEKVVKLRNAVVDRVKYESDLGVNNSTGNVFLGENWHLPISSFYGQVGDCDSHTILWVTACNICGIPADRLFNATGYYKPFNNDIGHSFGVAKFDDGNWYIIECTAKKTPVKFIGSDYKIKNDILNGLSNWAMSGKAKQEQW